MGRRWCGDFTTSKAELQVVQTSSFATIGTKMLAKSLVVGLTIRRAVSAS